MANSQSELCLKVLHRLHNAGVLKDMVIVGSWCTLFYKQYFKGIQYNPSLKTRDVDILIPKPSMIKVKADIAELLKEYDFVVGFTGSGYIRLEHPELIVEFLVPERGRATDKPYKLPQLGLNAQALRYLEFLGSNIIIVNADGLEFSVPHPAAYALHKLLILSRRNLPEKKIKDKESALQVLRSLVAKKDQQIVRDIFNSMPRGWQSKIKKSLADILDSDVADIFK